MNNVVKGHIYYTKEQKSELKALCPKDKFRIKWENNQEIVYVFIAVHYIRLGEIKLVLRDIKEKGLAKLVSNYMDKAFCII